MKYALVAALLFSTAAAAQEGVRVASVTVTSASPSTGSNPAFADFTVTSGSVIGTSVELKGVEGLRVSVCAVGGVLSGAGTLQANLANDRTGLPERNPSLDQTVSVTATSCAGTTCVCQVFPDLRVSGSRVGGRVMFVPSGVTHTGTGVIVRVYASVGASR